MSATPIIYSSTDAGAPVLDGTAGSLLSLLRAILVAGYGAKLASGWSEPFTAASDVAVFRNSSVGTGSYYRIDDNSVSGGRSAAYRGYKTMSALSTGAGEFPTVGQETAGLFIRKSAASGSTARGWWAIACRRWIYLFVDSNSTGLQFAQPYFWGDLESMRPADAYNGAIAGGRTADPAVGNSCSLFLGAAVTALATPAGVSTGMYIAGSFNQVASSTAAALLQPYGLATTVGGSAGYAYPHPVNTGLLYGRVLVNEAAYTARGWMPALYAPWHNRALSDLTMLTDVPNPGVNSVSKLFSSRPDGSSFSSGECIFDTTTAH